MKIYTAAEMREHEQMAVDKGTTFEQLMENAGQAAAADLLRRFPKAGRALIVCGKGNNGGDGLVIARVLSEQDWQVDVVFVLGDKLSPLAQLNRERLNHLDGVSFIRPDELEGRLKTGFKCFSDGLLNIDAFIWQGRRAVNRSRDNEWFLEPYGWRCQTAAGLYRGKTGLCRLRRGMRRKVGCRYRIDRLWPNRRASRSWSGSSGLGCNGADRFWHWLAIWLHV